MRSPRLRGVGEIGAILQRALEAVKKAARMPWTSGKGDAKETGWGVLKGRENKKWQTKEK